MLPQPKSVGHRSPLLLLYQDVRTAERLAELLAQSSYPVDLQAKLLSELERPVQLDRAVLVECAASALELLPELHAAAELALVPLIGVIPLPPPTAHAFGATSADEHPVESTLRSFEAGCHALVDASETSAVRQVFQYLRSHAQLATLRRAQATPSKPPRVRPRKNQSDKRVKFLRPYAEFFRDAPEGMLVVDARGTILYTNPAARSLVGVPVGTRHQNVFGYLQPSDVPRAKALAKLLATSTRTEPVDFSVSASTGARIVSVHASRTQRSPDAFLLTFRDVTEQRELERTLTHTKNFLQQVIDSSVDAIVSADLQGNILVFNRAAGRIFDYEPGDVVSKLNVRKLYPPGAAEAVMRLIRTRERTGGGQLEGHQTEMLDRQGRTVPVRLSAAFVREGSAIVATVGVFTDIRRELELGEKLRQAEAELHETEKGVALAQLAGMTAHELNQPLTIILGYSELLQRTCTQPDALNAAEVLANQAQRLAEIVRRIGRITRYETKGYVGGSAILDLDRSTGG